MIWVQRAPRASVQHELVIDQEGMNYGVCFSLNGAPVCGEELRKQDVCPGVQTILVARGLQERLRSFSVIVVHSIQLSQVPERKCLESFAADFIAYV
jgi:hypothetical protein